MTYEELLQKHEKELRNYYEKREKHWFKATGFGPLNEDTKKQFDATWDDTYRKLVATQYQEAVAKSDEEKSHGAAKKTIRDGKVHSDMHEQEMKDILGNAYHGTEQDKKDAMRAAIAKERGDKNSGDWDDKMEEIKNNPARGEDWFRSIGGTLEMLEEEGEQPTEGQEPKTEALPPGEQKAADKQATFERLAKMQGNLRAKDEQVEP